MSRSRDSKYRLWRRRVKFRDKCCVACDSKVRLNAHHKNSWRYYPLERYDIENGVTLCNLCHIRFHTDFKRSYQTKCTSYDFDNFMALVRHFKVALAR